MALLVYECDDNSREVKVVKFEVPNNMNIHEFKIVCTRLAASLGYSDKSIKKSFGELDVDTSDDLFFRKIFNKIKPNTPKN